LVSVANTVPDVGATVPEVRAADTLVRLDRRTRAVTASIFMQDAPRHRHVTGETSVKPLTPGTHEIAPRRPLARQKATQLLLRLPCQGG
jgi:hypothetical protein